MKLVNLLLSFALSFASASAFAISPPCFQYVLNGKMKIDIVEPQAGFEFPTETVIFPELAPYNVLTIGEGVRILVNNEITLACGWLQDHDKNFHVYLPRVIQRAVAGIDFPTDGPAHLDRDFAVWVVNEFQRIRLTNIAQIIRAEAGIDYPTDGPAQLDRDFHVMVLHSGKRIKLNR